MIFDLEEDKGAWFDMDGGGRVQLRLITPADWVAIKKATVSTGEPLVKKLDNGKYQLFERELVDEDLQREMVNDLTICAWEGLLDAKDRPIPCTKENKNRLMMMRDSRFRDFINDKLGVLSGIQAEQKEAEEKN